MKLTLQYENTRKFFQDGDIVFFSGGDKTLIRKIICWFSKGEQYHVGIVFWMTVGNSRRLMLAESQPDGFRIINLGFYSSRKMTVFCCPVKWSDIQERVTGSAGGVDYDFLDMALIGMHERFGTPSPGAHTGSGEVCSSIVARILNEGGMSLQTLVSPQNLFDQFLKNNLVPYMVSHS